VSHTEYGFLLGPADQIDAGDDVAPLIGAAELQSHVMLAVQLQKIVALQQRIGEFEKCQPLLAFQPRAHGIEGQHAADREMRTDFAQKFDEAEFIQPIRVVDQDGIARAVAEAQKRRDVGADAGQVGGDLRVGQQAARLFPEGRVADPRSAAAHHGDWPMAVLLEQPQQHDRDHVADMQRISGQVEAGIGGERAGGQSRVQRILVRALENEPAGAGLGQETAFRHTLCSLSGAG
jgi:hypothetical protein